MDSTKLSPEVVAEIQERYIEGESRGHIAGTMGISHRTVGRYCLNLDKRAKRNIRNQEIHRLMLKWGRADQS